MTQKAVGRFLWTYDNPNLNPNPTPEKQKFFLKKAREFAFVSLINQSKMTKKAVGRIHKLDKDDTKAVGRFLWTYDNPNPNPNTEKRYN